MYTSTRKLGCFCVNCTPWLKEVPFQFFAPAGTTSLQNFFRSSWVFSAHHFLLNCLTMKDLRHMDMTISRSTDRDERKTEQPDLEESSQCISMIVPVFRISHHLQDINMDIHGGFLKWEYPKIIHFYICLADFPLKTIPSNGGTPKIIHLNGIFH